MKSDEQRMRELLQSAQRRTDGEAPAFAASWAVADARYRRRPAVVAGAAAAIVAVIAVAMLSSTPESIEPNLVDMDELVASTSWVAPSDSLLPEHRFDIFQELPEMFESTGGEEGTLLHNMNYF